MASVLEKPKPVQAPQRFVEMYPKPKNEKEKRRIDHKAALTAMDESIGRLLNWLYERHLSDNTLVIFLSDNGGSATADNSPLRGQKGQMFEGGLRVPCIVRYPNRVPAGKVCDEFLTSLEIFPTLCQLTGTYPPPNVLLDGFDMLPVLRGKIPSPRKEMFWKRRGDVAARVGDWKWVDSAQGSGLFNIKEDVGEQNDLSTQKPDILQMVKSRFQNWQIQMTQAAPRGPFRDY